MLILFENFHFLNINGNNAGKFSCTVPLEEITGEHIKRRNFKIRTEL
jgi:hypothetical protein